MFASRKRSDPTLAESSDARRELLRRVLNSPTFQKSERLSSLLSFVCEMTLQGREQEINEQRIGEAVFMRARDYDSSVDGIVRTQASRLRTRLELYFSSDGAKEPVQIVIPRGGYVPRFKSRTLLKFKQDLPTSDDSEAGLAASLSKDSAEQLAGGAPELRASESPRWYASATAPWILVAILPVLVVWGLAFGLKQRNANKTAPVTLPHPLWDTIFAENQITLIVYGDSGLVMWQNFANRDVHLAEYLSRDYMKQSPPSASVNQTLLMSLGGRRYTSIVDLDIAETMQQMAMARNVKTEHRYARDLLPNDLKQGNVVLVGTAEANPWVELFEANMNFYFHNDRKNQVFSVINRVPKGSEPKQWDSAYNDAAHRVFAVVAYLPNLSGQGNALLLEGTSMAGTESAWDFVSDDSQLLPFLQRIRKPNGSIPHFEAVLGTNNVNGSAGKNVLLAWRTEH